MFQVRDPAIKLFGSDIPIHIPINSTHTTDSHFLTQIQSLSQPIVIMNGLEESTNAEVDVPLNEVFGKQADTQEDATGIRNMHKSATPKPEAKAVHRANEHRTDKRDIDQQEKVFKKPDKVLPCPRCNSLETKFCYFNNYNVNQPRHFCKNCQRYWTAGGTIRNVPVGAGKRRSKHSALQYCQVPVSPDGVSVIHTDSNTASDKHLSSSILKEEAPLSESLETMLNLKGHKKIEVESSTVKDDSEEHSSSSVRIVESREEEYSENGIEQVGLSLSLSLTQQCNGLIPLHSLHYYPAPPWSYQWNPCWNAMAFRPGNITSDPAYMDSATMMAVPGFTTPKLEVPVAPSSYWGCMPSWPGQKEEFSLVGSTFNGIPSPSSSVSSGTCSGNRSPTLGKHCRDGSIPEEDTTKPNLWVPKTLRINDPEEAAKSSIWSTLGIKSDEKNKPIMKGSVFKSFEPKSNASSRDLDDNKILRANPAAFSRSESFQENM